ncbi:hypothetical protein POM88_022780 [Heracleum sosnowskyi]|uniref:Endonuclease/exonuclease/phosphatase n=1 Tax=Heracleum sosnowskyi TaxID=360622 RepID=A0AAD8IJF9_9APIA|nr:hypothetical protein POM88_022780 [Heracleum sosnowskyi]
MVSLASLKDGELGICCVLWLGMKIYLGFKNALLEARLVDMNLVGHQFTFERGRDTEAWMEIRLDRALTNEAWLAMFPMAKLYNLEGSSSDHSPIFLVPRVVAQTVNSYRFRFENAWLMEPMCEQLVRD